MDNYTVIRSDRNINITNKFKGGGVLVTVNNSTSTYTLKEQYSAHYVRLDVIVNRDSYSIIISLVYFPPRTMAKYYSEYIHNLIDNISCKNYDNYLIAGDFNLTGY